ncbi:MAG: NUDIX hydrolase [Rhodobacterales bacterium]|nr:MAG: NUDIX hydrolase [Rhodobacterales bacterium]
MTLQAAKQLPLTLQAARKSDVRTQFAALCYRIVNGKPQVLLITSRGSGRWIIPKGWPMDEMTPGSAAMQEAWEEAGVVGKFSERCLGLFSYSKVMDKGPNLPCVAMVYPVKVKSLASKFPEAGQRRRKWFSPKKAATKVVEPELRQILKTFDPKLLKS